MSNNIPNNDVIYLDQKGYEEYLKKIEELESLYQSNATEKSEAYEVAVGDGWHDNFGFEQAKRDEDRILGELRRRKAALKRIVVVDKVENSDIVELNDYVIVKLSYGDSSKEDENIFKLIGSENGDVFAEISEISLNSPIGKAIYHKPVGYEGSFEVCGEKNKLAITRIAKSLEDLRKETKPDPGSKSGQQGPRLIRV